MFPTDLHQADTMLNPYLLDGLSITKMLTLNQDSWTPWGLTLCIDGQYVWVVAKFLTFKKHRGIFVNMPLPMEGNIPPYAWWSLVGEGGTHLIPLAKSMLAQVCSSSSCSYPFVHTKTRNMLSSARAENLIYIYTNERLVWERVGCDLAACNLMNMMSKDSIT